jgi:hypothetical protein
MNMALFKESDKLSLLKDEYFKLQDIVEAFDARALQIKGWSVTLSLAGLVAAFANKDAEPARMMIILLAVMSAICFWLVEFLWKCHQWTLLTRVEEIEAAMRGEDDLPAPLQINASFQTNWRRVLRRRAPMFIAPAVCLPHLLIVILGIALAGALPPGPMLH